MRAAYAWMHPTTWSGRSDATASRNRRPADTTAMAKPYNNRLRSRRVYRRRQAQEDREDLGALGVDEVSSRPAIEVVFGHARLGELFPAVVLAGSERPEEGVTPDLFVAARIVDLVELVPAGELGADRVPQKLHELDAPHGVDTVRTAQIEVQVLAQVRRLEVLRVRVEVNQAAGHRFLDQGLDLHVRLGRQHLVGGGRLHGRQDAAAGPRVGALGHRVRQSPDHVAPGDDLADVGLHAAERARAGDLGGLDQEASDEVELDRQTGAAVDERARQEAGRSEEHTSDPVT